jgi:hypothetical protein
LNRTVFRFAALAATLAASWAVLRWVDGRARLSVHPRKALESWENEGGTLSLPGRRIGADISQVPS